MLLTLSVLEDNKNKLSSIEVLHGVPGEFWIGRIKRIAVYGERGKLFLTLLIFKKREKMNILITGATGYIGSYLTEYLSKNTFHKIIPLCRKLPDYFKEWIDIFGDVVEVDITRLEDLKKKIPEKIDIVIHLAAFNNIDTAQMPEKALIVNGIGTRNILEIAKERKCKLFIFFSTVQVYGKKLQGIINIDSPIICEDDYSLTHYVAEEYCRMYSLKYNLNICVLRPSNIFGCPVHPKISRWNLAIPVFCLSAYKENKIMVKEGGKQMRDFVSLNFIGKSVDQLIKDNKNGFNVYNLTSENLFSILEIAETVQLLAKKILSKNIALVNKDKCISESKRFLVRNNLSGPLKRDVVKFVLINEIKKTLRMLAEV